jgi:hypothetical protein
MTLKGDALLDRTRDLGERAPDQRPTLLLVRETKQNGPVILRQKHWLPGYFGTGGFDSF